MTVFPALSCLYCHQWGRHRARRLATAAILAACTVLAAACSAGPAPVTAQQAVDSAARQAAGISSAAATLTENVGGETISGTVVEELRPALQLSMTLSVAAGGTAQTLGGIITSKAIYLHSPAFARATGKQWIGIPFASLNGANSITARLFKSLAKINPAEQAEVFAGARNVRKAGNQVIDGVQTTHYSGTILPSAALAALPSSLRKALAPGLKAVTGDVRFNMWIDSQSHIRKLLEEETVNGQTVTTTIVFSAINQPVHITVPPAGQVATVPSAALRGGTA